MSKQKTKDYAYHSKKTEEAPRGSFKKLCFALSALGLFLLIVVVLLCISLLTLDAEHLFMYLLVFHVSVGLSWQKCLSRPFGHFSIRLFGIFCY